MIITKELTIDLVNRTVPECVHTVQCDANTRAVAVTLMAGGVPWNPPEGAIASVAFERAGGSKGWYDQLPDGSSACTVAGNVVTAILAPEMLTAPGRIKAFIVFQNADLNQISTFGFTVEVDPSATAGNTVTNSYYKYSTLEALNAAMAAHDETIAELEQAKESGAFKGEKGDKGDKGDPGEQGPQGIQGEKGEAPDAVLYTPQTLTPEQQAQARENIGTVAKSTLLTEPSVNLFDETTFVRGKIILASGEITTNNSWGFGDYIDISGNEIVTFSNDFAYYAFYDTDKNFLVRKYYAGSNFVQVPENAAFVIAIAKLADYSHSTAMVVAGEYTGEFVPFSPSKIRSELLDAVLYTPQTLTDKQKAQARKNIGASQGFDPTEQSLPIFYFNGNTTGISKDNKVTLDYIHGDRSGTCTLKWQGSSSLAHPKKNYTVVFDTAFEAKSGWGEQKKYCLKANYIDFSHARNICAARIWAKLVSRKPDGYYGAVTVPATPNYGAIDGFPCLVVINGEYQGLYTFNIPKDAWMMGMGSGTKEAILCCSGNVAENSPVLFRSTATTLDGNFDLEYVTDENNSDWVLESLNNMITACINNDGTNIEALYNYIDVSSAMDYMIYLVALKHHDGFQKNYILATYDGVKWFFSAYDMDSTFGIYSDGSYFLPAYQNEANVADTFRQIAEKNRLFEIIWNNPTLKAQVVARWKLYTTNSGLMGTKNLPLHPAFVEYVFRDFSKDIPKAVLDEEVRLWTGIPSTSQNNISQILEWYRLRLERVNVELGV